MIAFLWAEDRNGVIGHNGILPWRLPNDMKFFKQMTTNQVVVMGRKTFEGMGKKALPNRMNIVITSDPSYEAEDVEVMHNHQAVMDFINKIDKDIFIIGGAVVFASFIKEVNLLYRTVIDESFAGDTYMIPIDWEQWELIEATEGKVDEQNIYSHRFETYARK